MRVNFYFLIMAWFFSWSGYAHDEGHGPKLDDSGKYGGVVAPIIDIKEAKKGAQASVVYKAELVLSSDGKVRLYLYDKSMKPLDLSKLEKTAQGVLEVKVKGKYKEEKFSLKLEEHFFAGQAPKSPAKPFNLDFHLRESGRELLTAFDNLD